jgi:hypothetical protein
MLSNESSLPATLLTISSGNNDFNAIYYYTVVVVVVVVGATVVVVVVVGAAVVVVVVVGLQHSYVTISCHLPTLGLLLRRIKLPATTLPCPSNLTNAFKFRFSVLIFF